MARKKNPVAEGAAASIENGAGYEVVTEAHAVEAEVARPGVEALPVGTVIAVEKNGVSVKLGPNQHGFGKTVDEALASIGARAPWDTDENAA